MLLQFDNGPFHEKKILAKCIGRLSPSNSMQVTILASSWQWSLQLFFIREFTERLARFPQLKVTMLVPEGSCREHDNREARIDGLTIVEAKKQPAFPYPKDWLIFPPEDLSTDIVIGLGEELGQIAQLWKKRDQCKSLYVACDVWFSKRFAPTLTEFHSLEQSEVKETLCRGADIPIATGPKMTEELSASLRSDIEKVFNLTPGIISEFFDINHDPHAGRKFRVLIIGGDDSKRFEDEGLDIAAEAVAELKDKFYHLVYVGAGKEDTKEKFTKNVCDCGIAKSQLTVRSLPNGKEG